MESSENAPRLYVLPISHNDISCYSITYLLTLRPVLPLLGLADLAQHKHRPLLPQRSTARDTTPVTPHTLILQADFRCLFSSRIGLCCFCWRGPDGVPGLRVLRLGKPSTHGIAAFGLSFSVILIGGSDRRSAP